MDRLALGLFNKEIVRDLQMTKETVKIHVNAIYRIHGTQTWVSAVAAMAVLGGRLQPIAAAELGA